MALAVAAILATAWIIVLDDVVAAGRAYDRGLSRWEASEPASYSFVYSECLGMCMDCPQLITVRDGAVTDAVVRGDGGCGQPNHVHAPTIEDVFGVADRRRPGLVPDDITTTVTYDEKWGFPASIVIECPDGYMDCGGGWSVSDFEVLS